MPARVTTIRHVPGRAPRRLRRRSGALRGGRGLDRGGAGGRLVPGTDGVRSARPWIAQHPGRSPRPQDAVADEPADQVPRVVRPFAPAVLRERCSDYFLLRPDDDRPYMSIVAPVAEARRRPVDGDGRQGFDRLRAVRSDVPAVTHVDYSARLQTVDAARHGRFDTLLRTFEAKTGCPVTVNTSFNVRGEPIVRTPDDAWRCFMATCMDALVLGRSVLLQRDTPTLLDGHEGQLEGTQSPGRKRPRCCQTSSRRWRYLQ